MAKGDLCKVIIRDDFSNVLIVQKKAKRGEKKVWSLVSKELKTRETGEKCVHRAIKEELKTIVFDLEKLKEEKISENLLIVYVGSIKERVSSNDSVEKIQWISNNTLENYTLNDSDKNLLREFFEKR